MNWIMIWVTPKISDVTVWEF